MEILIAALLITSAIERHNRAPEAMPSFTAFYADLIAAFAPPLTLVYAITLLIVGG